MQTDETIASSQYRAVDFRLPVGGDQSQADHVIAYGPGLTHGACNESASFRIVTKDAGSGDLSVAVEGSSKAEIRSKDNRDGTCDVTYWPTAPGEYTITVKFAGKHVVGSPFTVDVDGHSSNRLRESISQIGGQCKLSLKIPGRLIKKYVCYLM